MNLDLDEALTLSLKFADTPDVEPTKLDLLKAYDQAAVIQRDHPDDWLEEWGKWVSSQAGRELEYSEVRQLWEHVASIATDVLEACKKKAETIASSLCSTVVPRLFTNPSLN